MSDFEQSIFASVNEFTRHFQNVNLKEKNTLEIMGILLYGGKFMNTSEKQLNEYRFSKYIDMTIDYYSKYLYNENLNFHFVNSQSKDEIKNEILQSVQDEKNKNKGIHYKSILNTITLFVKSKYMIYKNNQLYNKNIIYRELFTQKYIAIDSNKYIQFCIIDENIDDFSLYLSHYQNGKIISKENIISIYNESKNNRYETLFLEELCNKYNFNYSDISIYIVNILKNVIKTPFYYESIYKDFFENIIEEFSTVIEIFITDKDVKFFNFIEEINKSIVNKSIELKDSINNDYPHICMEAIISNKLNINESTTKMFYEYFMSFKSEAQYYITTNNNNTLSKIC